MPNDEIFDDPFMNDMLLNPDLYGLDDSFHDAMPGVTPDIMNSDKRKDDE